MSWYPGAIRHTIRKENYGGIRSRKDGGVLHSAASNAGGKNHAIYWGREITRASSTFYVDYDGTKHQYYPLATVPYTSANGNWRMWGLESQGWPTEPWTPEQVTAIAEIIAWAAKEEKTPIRQMTNTLLSQRGIGWHDMPRGGGEQWNPNAHYCPGKQRAAQIPQIIALATRISGGAAVGTPSTPASPSKSVSAVAKEVIDGKWGNGNARKAALVAAGYNYSTVQSEVNRILSGGGPVKVVAPTKASVETVARAVIAGKYGNGAARTAALTKAGYNAATVQAEVNRILSGGKPVASGAAKKSNEQLANEVIYGLWGNGADRQSRLTKAGYDPKAVQAIVNSKLR